MRISNARRVGSMFIAGVLAMACDSGPTQVEPSESAISSSPVLVECPSSASRSVSRTLSSLGGVIQLDGHSLTVPLGALTGLTQFTMTVPASRFVEVHVTANGAHGFHFLDTAVLTVSYARCQRQNFTNGRLTAYKIHPETKALLKQMPATDIRLLRHVVILTDSLSAYAIAQ